MKSITTLTINPALDKSTSIARLMPEHKLKCKVPSYAAGGGGINVARVIKRLDGMAKAIYQSSGEAGFLIKSLLDKELIESIPFATKEWTRENFIVVDESTNQQYRFGMPGPNYSKAELDVCLDLVKKTAQKNSFLVISGSIPDGVPVNFYAKISKWAKSEDVKVILDTSGPALKESINEGVFLVKPNLKELSELAGLDFIEGHQQEEIAMSLIHDKKAEIVVVSLGARGAMMASQFGIEYITPPTVKTKSTVGAGDSMVGGMTWALANNLDYSDVLKYGIACGTATTMNEGTQLCQLKDVTQVYEYLKAKN